MQNIQGVAFTRTQNTLNWLRILCTFRKTWFGLLIRSRSWVINLGS